MLKNREDKYRISGECPKCSAPTCENQKYPGKVFYTCNCFPFEDKVSLNIILDDSASIIMPKETRPLLN